MDNEERKRKREELKLKREKVRQMKLKRRENLGILDRQEKQKQKRENPQEEEKKEEVVEEEKGLDLGTFIGVYNYFPQVKNYKYDQAAAVTEDDLELMNEMKEEEELPVFEYKSESDEEVEEEEVIGGEDKGPKRLDEEEVRNLYKDPKFCNFMRKGSEELEDALNTSYTLVEDILELENPNLNEDMRERVSNALTLKSEDIPKDEHFSTIGTDWCRTRAEHLLGVYSSADQNVLEPGKLIVWDITQANHAVNTISYSKRITKAQFNHTDENILYCATDTGQICVWDVRTSCDKPVQKTIPSLEGHTNPIYCLNVVNDGTRDLIIATSSDGKLRTWNPSNLSTPGTSLDFFVPSELEVKGVTNDESEPPLMPMTWCFDTIGTPGPESKIFFGYFESIIQSFSTKSFIFDFKENPKVVERFVGHDSPVCSLGFNHHPGYENINGLVASGSFDFSVKIWQPKNLPSNKNILSPLSSFDVHNDYVTAVDWNPQHPAMLISADCGGKMCLWNFLEDRDYPAFMVNTSEIFDAKWHPDGLKIAVTRSDAELSIWQMKKRYLKVDDAQLVEFDDFCHQGPSN